MTKATEPRERFVRLAAALRQQRQQIAQVVAEAREALSDFAERKPPLRELLGIGAILHDFYTGIEHLFAKIAPEHGGLPAGPAWHRELLEIRPITILRPAEQRSASGRARDRAPTVLTRRSDSASLVVHVRVADEDVPTIFHGIPAAPSPWAGRSFRVGHKDSEVSSEWPAGREGLVDGALTRNGALLASGADVITSAAGLRVTRR